MQVTLNLYDLSQGMARQFSPMLLGKQIDGIWHTGIIVYGKEFYFGGGICQGTPGQTPYGRPLKQIELGFTDKSEAQFQEFLVSISHLFTFQTYDVFNNNCNNFCDKCSLFLIGQPIPSYITGLPQEVLNTQFGAMIKPMMDNMMNQMNQQSLGSQMFPSQQQAQQQYQQQYQQQFQQQLQSNPSLNSIRQNQQQLFNNVLGSYQKDSNGLNSVNQSTQNHVQDVDNFEQFFDILENNEGMVVDFFSYTCPPCMKIKPIYSEIASEFSLKCDKLKFIAVNTAIARDIAESFEIKSIPTFIFFYKQDQYKRFSGADVQQLRRTILELVDKIGASQSNVQEQDVKNEQVIQQKPQVIKFNVFDPSTKQLLFFDLDKLDLPLSKIKQNKDSSIDYQADLIEQLETKKDFKQVFDNNTDDIKRFINFILNNIKLNNSDQVSWVPYLDLLRGSESAVSEICDQIVFHNQSEFLSQLLDILVQEYNKSSVSMPKAVRVLSLRVLNNLFNSIYGRQYLGQNLITVLKLAENMIKNGETDRVCLQSMTYILYNFIILEQNLSLEQYTVKSILSLLKQIVIDVQQQSDDTQNLALLIALLKAGYKNELILQHIQISLNINSKSEELKKFLQSKMENVNLATKDLINVLEKKI